jgi:hypothetical protein
LALWREGLFPPCGRIKGRYQCSPKCEVYVYALLTCELKPFSRCKNHYPVLNLAGFDIEEIFIYDNKIVKLKIALRRRCVSFT